MKRKRDIVVRNGAVALFDVLGYQELLFNNTVEKAVTLARENLVALPETIEATTYQALGIDQNGFLAAHVHDLQWLIFSDTILLALEFPSRRFPFPCPKTIPRNLRPELQQIFVTNSQWIVFLNVCAALMRQLFAKGLPLRGAIHFGEYYVDPQCFAGLPIVTAHRDASQQDWSGCTVDDSIQAQYKQILQSTGADKPGARWVLIDYPVPTKQGTTEIRSVINWAWLRGSPFVKKLRTEPSKFVRDSFSAHKKNLSPQVELKLQNTETFIRHINSGNAFKRIDKAQQAD